MNILARNSGLRRAAATLLIATLAVRALLPLGYMPGNILAGEFAELCPVSSAATFQLLGAEASQEHHHGADDSAAYSIGATCPIGSSLFFDALPTLLAQTAILRQEHVLPNIPGTRSYLAAVSPSYAARAPPTS